MTHKKSYDVAVIGGGVVGSAITYHLSKAGVKTVLLEKGDICSGTSGTNPGFCVLMYREDQFLLNTALEQACKMPGLTDELGIDIEYVQTGGLIPLTDHAQLEVVGGMLETCKQWGLKDVSLVSPDRALQQEPHLDASKIIAAAYCPTEGRLNPFKLTLGFAHKARELGADILTHTQVTGFEVVNGEVKEVVTSYGSVKANLIILAAGAWTREIAKMAGVDIPVNYERGEAMASIPYSPLIRGMVTDGALFVKSANRPAMVVGACLTQTVSGNIIMAQATTDVHNYDCSSTYEGPVAVAQKVLFYFPKFKGLEIIRMWGGIVAYAQDRKPVFGLLWRPNNIFLVVGFHSAIGISPALGEIVRDFICKGYFPAELVSYSPGRFCSNSMALFLEK
ncbi:MAG: FAD-binding oxidoreductase [Bacillota bacterium]